MTRLQNIACTNSVQTTYISITTMFGAFTVDLVDDITPYLTFVLLLLSVPAALVSLVLKVIELKVKMELRQDKKRLALGLKTDVDSLEEIQETNDIIDNTNTDKP